MDKCGVYSIRHCESGRFYIGSSCRINARWYAHRRALKMGTHQSPYLQNVWSKYGEGAFVFEVLEECVREDLLVREQLYLDLLNPVFNTCKQARSRAGVPHSPAVKEKIRQAHRARPPFTEEHRANISAKRKEPETNRKICLALRSREHSEEQLEKMRLCAQQAREHCQTPAARAKRSVSHRGHQWTPEQKTRLSEMRKGHVVSEETRRKISEGQKGHPVSEAQRAKQAAALRGRKLTPEHCAKLSESHKGHALSDETKAKISAANKGEIRPRTEA